ncbi:MAG: hypothetical protein ACR2RD_05735 [Woeseiaceae bacterium]
MVASQATLTTSAATLALDVAKQMETHADAGDWDRIEVLAERLRALVTEVPDAERRAVLVAVQRSINNIAAGATEARQTVSGKMAELRRGQVAKKAYELR